MREREGEPEVEAAWRAEFERSGATQLRDALNSERWLEQKAGSVSLDG
jgi:hypothetical protein